MPKPKSTQKPVKKATKKSRPTTPLREKMRQDMVLRNYSPFSIKQYLWQIGALAKYWNKSPSLLTEEEIREYLRVMREEKHAGIQHFKKAVAAIRFFYKNTVHMPRLQESVRYPRSEKRIPAVLTKDEVVRLLGCIEDVRDKTVLQVFYGAGLRMGEALGLRIADINAKEMLLRVRQGKGNKERYVMLSPALLTTLRAYWKMYRPKEWLFPHPNGKDHIGPTAIRKACHAAAIKAKIAKVVTSRTLRHSYATALLDDGTDLRIIQTLLGHSNINTTTIYTHVSTKAFQKVRGPLDGLA